MAGGGDDVSRALEPGKGERRGHRQKAARLPLDVVVAIAARSDPATLVRFAATCRDARRRIAGDPKLLGRLRLRDTDRFVPALLRGHMTGTTTFAGGVRINSVYMVDTTGAADATRLVEAEAADDTLWNGAPLDSRGGLALVRNNQGLLVVCNLAATRLCQALPPEPEFPHPPEPAFPHVRAPEIKYVLIVGNRDDEGGDGAGAGAGAVGRHYQVLKARIMVPENSSYSLLLVHTFSSEHGEWSPLKEIPISNQLGSGNWLSRSRPLVVGDVVHWLCLTNTESCMVMLHLGAARVNVTTTSLPANFPRYGRDGKEKYSYMHPYGEARQYLLATATAGGNPVVLVADMDKISAWELLKDTKIWKPRPEVVIENETVLGFKDDGLAELVEERRWGKKRRQHVPELLWFAERSGIVLLRIHGFCLLWLDLHSKKIVRCFLDHRLSCAQVHCTYEMDLSSWVPTFSSVVSL